jgi:hypothetical protein
MIRLWSKRPTARDRIAVLERNFDSLADELRGKQESMIFFTHGARVELDWLVRVLAYKAGVKLSTGKMLSDEDE